MSSELHRININGAAWIPSGKSQFNGYQCDPEQVLWPPWVEAAQCCGKSMCTLLVLLLLYWIIGYSISEVGKVTWDNVSKVQRKQAMEKGFVNCQVLYEW